MINIAMVEDTAEDLQRFEAFFASYAGEKQLDYELTTFPSGEDFLMSFSGQYDVIFLDIELGGITGLETGAKIREKDEEVLIIFLTKMGQFAINGYEVGAADYILKPLNEQIFTVKLNKLFRRMSQRGQLQETLSLGGGRHIVSTDQIFYVEVLKHDVTFHTAEGDFTERGSLREVEGKVSAFYFARLSNSFLVNLKYIAGIRKNEVQIKNGDVLTLSRSKKAEFLDKFNRFLGGAL